LRILRDYLKVNLTLLFINQSLCINFDRDVLRGSEILTITYLMAVENVL